MLLIHRLVEIERASLDTYVCPVQNDSDWDWYFCLFLRVMRKVIIMVVVMVVMVIRYIEGPKWRTHRYNVRSFQFSLFISLFATCVFHRFSGLSCICGTAIGRWNQTHPSSPGVGCFAAARCYLGWSSAAHHWWWTGSSRALGCSCAELGPGGLDLTLGFVAVSVVTQ